MHFIKGWALLFSPDLLHGTLLGNHIKDFSFFSYQSNEAGEHIRCHIINMAKSKLINGEQITQTAYDLGFEYPQHLSRIFKKQTGQTLSEYSRDIRERKFR